MSEDTRRPPEGDWLGTQFLRFERHGPLAHVIVDRPEARNALTPAMYFGIRYAIDHVNRTPELAGLLITGTGDVFMPGGDLGGANEDGCRTAPSARFDVKRTLHEYYGHYDRMAMDASISGDEMVEGFRAFKERRSPSWVPEELRTEGRL